MLFRTGTILFCAILVLAPLSALYATETPVVLETIVTDIDGKTRRGALLRELRLSEGLEFESGEELQRVVGIRVRDLVERGLFEEFEFELVEVFPGSYRLEILITDAPTLIPAPMVVYSSDLGIIVGGNIVYRNAFGSMTDQMLLGFWSPARTFVTARVENIAAGPVTLDAKFSQVIGTSRFGSPSGDIVLRYDSMISLLSLRMDIPMGLDSPWAYWLEPIASYRYGFDFDYNVSSSLGDDQFEYPGFAPGLDHGVSFDGIEREVNLRRGIAFEVENANFWYTADNDFDVFLESDLIGLVPAAEWLEFSGRIGGFHALSGTRREAGDRLRGTKDYMTYGTSGAYATAQVNFRAFRSRGGFELHIRPFADIGYVRSSEWDDGMDAFEYCAGSSFILYFAEIPSLSVNLDFGWDFKRGDLEVLVGFEPFI